MKIAVLTTPASWYFKDLVRAAGGRHEMTCVSFPNLQARVGKSAWTGIRDEEYDVVLVRSMPPGSLEQIIFRMDVLARWQAGGTRIVNSPKALEAAIDKYLSLSLLGAAGLDVPETMVCQTLDAGLAAFQALGGDVVVKPIFGGEGRGLIRVSEIELAERALRSLITLGSVVYMQKYIDHGNEDYRLLVIGEQVMAMKRTSASDWRTNASRGAVCEAWSPSDQDRQLAAAAARAIGTEMAGVDLLKDASGQTFVVEINAVPGWRALSAATQTDVSRLLIDYLEAAPASAQ